MFNRTVNAFVSTLVIMIATSSVTAAPHSRNAAKNIEKNKTQVSQIETIYAALIKEKALQKFSDRKPALLKASFTPNKPKPKRVLKNANRNKSYARSLRVTATAYTSHVNQTDSTPNIAAWGDRLKPGMKSIAVSRDLLKKYGLKRGQKVRIKGLKGEYRVLDKMNKRWKKKIDIYMGMDKRRAFKWGRRKVDIYWN
ncbi:MAG: 3D domain-containing protein [Cocleimonas sp.]|nr:3D domain-containing protein [Cocleimonas sp.]